MRQQDENEMQWRRQFAKTSDQDDDGLPAADSIEALSDADRERCAFGKRLD